MFTDANRFTQKVKIFLKKRKNVEEASYMLGGGVRRITMAAIVPQTVRVLIMTANAFCHDHRLFFTVSFIMSRVFA